jgi:hypothetical protein
VYHECMDSTTLSLLSTSELQHAIDCAYDCDEPKLAAALETEQVRRMHENIRLAKKEESIHASVTFESFVENLKAKKGEK